MDASRRRPTRSPTVRTRLSRSLYIYVNNEATAAKPEVAGVRRLLPDGTRSLATGGLVEQVGYIALPSDRVDGHAECLGVGLA